MIGHLIYSSTHRGTSFSIAGLTYVLLNGQTVARASAGLLSAYWPTDAYGSTSTVCVMPDLSSGRCLRGSSFDSGRDPDFASRTTSSGQLPVASGVGSLQSAQMGDHTHPSGTYPSSSPYRASSGPTGATFPTGSCVTIDMRELSKAASGTINSDVTLSHMKFYPYLCVS